MGGGVWGQLPEGEGAQGSEQRAGRRRQGKEGREKKAGSRVQGKEGREQSAGRRGQGAEGRKQGAARRRKSRSRSRRQGNRAGVWQSHLMKPTGGCLLTNLLLALSWPHLSTVKM